MKNQETKRLQQREEGGSPTRSFCRPSQEGVILVPVSEFKSAFSMIFGIVLTGSARGTSRGRTRTCSYGQVLLLEKCLISCWDGYGFVLLRRFYSIDRAAENPRKTLSVTTQPFPSVSSSSFERDQTKGMCTTIRDGNAPLGHFGGGCAKSWPYNFGEAHHIAEEGHIELQHQVEAVCPLHLADPTALCPVLCKATENERGI